METLQPTAGYLQITRARYFPLAVNGFEIWNMYSNLPKLYGSLLPLPSPVSHAILPFSYSHHLHCSTSTWYHHFPESRAPTSAHPVNPAQRVLNIFTLSSSTSTRRAYVLHFYTVYILYSTSPNLRLQYSNLPQDKLIQSHTHNTRPWIPEFPTCRTSRPHSPPANGSAGWRQ